MKKKSASPIFAKYPNIKTLRARLIDLKNEISVDQSLDEISTIFHSYFELMPLPEGLYQKENFNRFKFYRVRLNIDAEKEDLNLIQTYSYPLPQFCKSNGRANTKNRSVFYCSNHALTAILESKPKAGETGYLSIWGGRSDREMTSSVILSRYLRAENFWFNMTENLYLYLENFAKETFGRKSNQFHEFVDFVADLFVEENFPYPLTSYISNRLLYEGECKDFIIYPSFENDSYSCNMAIHPNVVDNHLVFEKVLKFTITEMEEDGFSMTTGAVGEIVNNNVTWRQATQEEMEITLYPMEI